ncbi:MAG: DUF1998 domain-containing protein [Syntrophobacterales bacterium]|nr:DUF1998 domain-containing protein [Syntrophobacterales bacterium]
MAIQQFIKRLKNPREERWDILHHAVLDPKDPVIAPIETAVSEGLSKLIQQKALTGSGVNLVRMHSFRGLYTHQALALKAIRSGKHVVVSTPMASGKSLIYYLAFSEALIENPNSKALFVFPIKALSRDQLDAASTFFSSIFPDVKVAVYDGDTSPKERISIRDSCPSIIITNPDMLHCALLPYHTKWQRLWEDLCLVVLDEIHTYRGVLGSHVAQILRRLWRVQNFYKSSQVNKGDLKFVLLSATIGNPLELSSQLTGIPEEEMILVDTSSAPLPPRHFLFLKSDFPLSLTASWILAEAVSENLKTIVFTRSRRMTELIFLTMKQRFPHLAKHISSYRAGLLPSDRREIEQRFSQKNGLRGIISTSAMELGVDIGNLDVCVLVGYPGTIMSTWQRAGRVGRAGQESAIVLIPQADALDQYIITHPEHLLFGKTEVAVADAKNPHILSDHLLCAAAEYPIQPRELERNPHWTEHLSSLKAVGKVFYSKDGTWVATSSYPHRFVDIRQTGRGFTIFLKDLEKDRLLPIGFIDGVRAFRECHPGAIYLHLGETYEVTEFDLLRRRIVVSPFSGEYFTMASSIKETRILEVLKYKRIHNFNLRLGRLRIKEQITGYEKKSVKSLEIIGQEPLDLPPQHYETLGFWIEIDPSIQEMVRKLELHFMGGIHALEHAIISMFPLLILCDRGDIGGIAYPLHPEVGRSAIFIYDGYEGGIGICEKAFDMIEPLLDKVRQLLESCSCLKGCPSCIHSPRCGSGNKPLDKEAAKKIAQTLLQPVSLTSINPVILVEDKEVTKEKSEETETRIAFMNLETQFLAHEVGGWHNTHLMKVSVAVVYDELKDGFIIYPEDEMERLIRQLTEYDLIVGFNILDFDYRVLSYYTDVDLRKHLPTLDILKDVYLSIGRRISLEHLASVNIKEQKTANGIQAVQWFREGRWDDLVDYCRRNVMITRKLFYKGLSEGGLYYCDRDGSIKFAPLHWSLGKSLKRGSL